ncbi:MAG: PDZ domain-containing protein [Phycisphaeraceae bacterium]|nr:MAG: PDZ domain-containing protein [Phycisphaeraceae bacterium]
MHFFIRHFRTRAITTLAILALTGAGAVPALAEEKATQELDTTILSLITDLDDEDLFIREAAMEELYSMSIPPEELLRHAAPIEDLSFEQWSRLDEILRELFISTPRAGLGAGLVRLDNPPGVRLNPIIRNFPIAETLQNDDIVTSVNGVDLRGDPIDDLTIRATILSHDPGDTLDLRIIRDGRTMNTTVKLGRYDDLMNAQPLNEQFINAAWALRRTRLGFHPPGKPQIAVVLHSDKWPSHQVVGRLQRHNMDVVAGGGAGDGVDSFPRHQLRTSSQNRMGDIRMQRIEIGGEVRQVAPRNEENARAQTIRGLRHQLETQLRVIRTQQAILDNPDTAEQERMVAGSILRRAEVRAAELRAILERIDP